MSQKFSEVLEAFNKKAIDESEFVNMLTTNKVEKDTAINLVKGIAAGLKPAIESTAWRMLGDAERTQARANMVKNIEATVKSTVEEWLKVDPKVNDKKATPRQAVFIVNYFTGVMTPVQCPKDFDLTARAYLADAPCKGHSFLSAVDPFDKFINSSYNGLRAIGLLIISESYARKGFNFVCRDAEQIKTMRKNYALWQGMVVKSLQSGSGEYTTDAAPATTSSTQQESTDSYDV